MTSFVVIGANEHLLEMPVRSEREQVNVERSRKCRDWRTRSHREGIGRSGVAKHESRMTSIYSSCWYEVSAEVLEMVVESDNKERMAIVQ